MSKAFAMISGGLDSGLAAKVIASLGIEVLCVTFKSAFFGSGRGQALARHLNLSWREIDFTTDHLDMVKNPAHGYGRNMNPCIDCHAMMISHLSRLVDRDSGDFIITGEVLGQRPMSQNERALVKVANASGAADILLRPLSAKLLPPTPMELDGRVDRSRLLGLSGRSRKPQIKLAASFGLLDYPSPAGGCSLTDPGFSIRLDELFFSVPDCSPEAVSQLYFGRHFRLPSGIKVIIPRNEAECEIANGEGALPGDVIMEPNETTGPSCLISGEGSQRFLPQGDSDFPMNSNHLLAEAVKEAMPLFAAYLKAGTRSVSARVKSADETWIDLAVVMVPTPMERDDLQKFHVCGEKRK